MDRIETGFEHLPRGFLGCFIGITRDMNRLAHHHHTAAKRQTNARFVPIVEINPSACRHNNRNDGAAR